MESQKNLSQKGCWQVILSDLLFKAGLTPRCSQVAQSLIHSHPKHLQGCRFPSLSRQPCPIYKNKIFQTMLIWKNKNKNPNNLPPPKPFPHQYFFLFPSYAKETISQRLLIEWIPLHTDGKAVRKAGNYRALLMKILWPKWYVIWKPYFV